MEVELQTNTSEIVRLGANNQFLVKDGDGYLIADFREKFGSS